MATCSVCKWTTVSGMGDVCSGCHARALSDRIATLEARNEHLEKATREACIELKEWYIRFPVHDPEIARRMVEDRAKAELAMDLEKYAALAPEAERTEDEENQACRAKTSF